MRPSVYRALFGTSTADPAELLERLWTGLVEDGVALRRATVALRTLHPEIVGLGYVWEDGQPIVCNEHAHGEFALPRFLSSPLRVIFEGHGPLRLPLEGHAPLPFPALEDLRARGLTDYLALPLGFSNGQVHALTLVTDRPGGFLAEELALFDELAPALAVAVEARETRRVAHTLLTTYVGERAGAHVLDGRIRRGDVELVDAVVLWSDLRGFTRMSLELEPEGVVEVLNGYFERVCEPIEAAGGEVVKFMGDGLLATFRIEAGDPRPACALALATARAGLGALVGQRIGRRGVELHMGVALHLGQLALGNIGSKKRLDFTVIGQTVNLTSRLAGICAHLDVPLVVSRRFAECLPEGAVSMGLHQVRGLPAPEELFTYR